MKFLNPYPEDSEVKNDENQNDLVPEDTETATESESETSGETETIPEESESESSGQEDEETGKGSIPGETDAPDASTVESPAGGSDLHDTPGVSGNGSELEEESYYSDSFQIPEEFKTAVTEELHNIHVQIVCGNFILALIAGILIGKLILGRLK